MGTPLLSQLARRVLAMSTSQGLHECQFSCAGHMRSKTRNLMSPDQFSCVARDNGQRNIRYQLRRRALRRRKRILIIWTTLKAGVHCFSSVSWVSMDLYSIGLKFCRSTIAHDERVYPGPVISWLLQAFSSRSLRWYLVVVVQRHSWSVGNQIWMDDVYGNFMAYMQEGKLSVVSSLSALCL